MHETQPLNVICNQNKIMLFETKTKYIQVLNQKIQPEFSNMYFFHFFCAKINFICLGSCGLRMTIYDSDICIFLALLTMMSYILFTILLELGGYFMVLLLLRSFHHLTVQAGLFEESVIFC